MTVTNSLPYYPRFIFNCNDGNCLTTGDLELFKFIKEKGSDYDITRFKTGEQINISWVNDNDETEVKTYIIDHIDIHQIKYDLDEPTYGMNSNDCTGLAGKEKKWMMEIYVFLNKV